MGVVGEVVWAVDVVGGGGFEFAHHWREKVSGVLFGSLGDGTGGEGKTYCTHQ